MLPTTSCTCKSHLLSIWILNWFTWNKNGCLKKSLTYILIFNGMSPHTSRKFFISQTNQGYILIYEKNNFYYISWKRLKSTNLPLMVSFHQSFHSVLKVAQSKIEPKQRIESIPRRVWNPCSLIYSESSIFKMARLKMLAYQLGLGIDKSN